MRFFHQFRLLMLVLFASTAMLGAAQVMAQASPATEIVKPATTTVENPYGIEAMWAQGDFVSKATLVILIIMSMGSWYIGIVKILEQNRLFKEGKEARAEFWKAPSVTRGNKSWVRIVPSVTLRTKASRRPAITKVR